MRSKGDNLFDLIPVKSRRVHTEKKGDISVIVFPRFRSRLLQKILLPRRKSPDIHITLDAHGTAVWDLIDGERTAGEIARQLDTHFENESGYAYRIAAFITQLQQHGYIKLERPAARQANPPLIS
jgi:hypothetical protein